MRPIVLCILDGVGVNNESYGNAFKQASTPNFDYLWNKYPHSLLEASGELVGLPAGQMGNSEVGHMNIGAGRISYQPLELITKSIRDGSIKNNENILKVINHVKRNNSKLHIMGLLSDGGVHSHINQLLGLIDVIKETEITKLYFHLFLDGRDTLPNVAYDYISTLEEKIKKENLGKISTVSGRYYAMDRDNRFERIKMAYDAIVLGIGEEYNTTKEVIDKNYERKISDEFVIPAVLNKEGKINENDGIIVFNFRPDRLRQLFMAITNPNFDKFERNYINNLKLVTMMPVSEDVISSSAFKLEKLENTLGEYLSEHNISQLRIAETEKYAHVTYFFDGGIEKKLKKSNRILIPSSKVATYDLKPEMSVYEITDALLVELAKNMYDVVILNYANGDMVGHTGDFEATIKAVEAVDSSLGRLYKKLKEIGGTLIVTSDHGNCELMLDSYGNKVTSHTNNPVPFIITLKQLKLKNGKLGDIAPTILELLNLEKPEEMSGVSLISKS